MSRFGVTGILSHPAPTTSDLECSSSQELFHDNLEIQSLSENPYYPPYIALEIQGKAASSTILLCSSCLCFFPKYPARHSVLTEGF